MVQYVLEMTHRTPVAGLYQLKVCMLVTKIFPDVDKPNLSKLTIVGDCPWDVYTVDTPIQMDIKIHIRELPGPRPLRRGVDTAKLGYWHPSTTDIYISSYF